MKDNLEKFIDERRADFDQLEPRADSWKGIEKQMSRPKKNYALVWKVAAMILLATSIGLLVERNFLNNPDELADVEPMNEELLEVEQYYTGLISQKRAEIKLTIQEKNLNDVDLLEDLQVLDDMYVHLKSDLGNNINNEKLINAMIRNLQLRVEILNKQLEILKRLEKHENDEVII